MYIDGDEVARKTGSGLNINSNDFDVGVKQINEHDFSGCIHSVRLFSNALAADEIKAWSDENCPIVQTTKFQTVGTTTWTVPWSGSYRANLLCW